MLNATRRLLSGSLHPLERSASLELVSLRGGAEDAEVLLPLLLADPVVHGDLVVPITRHGGTATATRLFETFVVGDRLVEHAPEDLLWTFGWAGLEQSRAMLFDYACEPNWDTAPAAIDGLVHLSPQGLEDAVRAAVETCVGRNLFAEYLPALAGWIGDADLVDRFLVEDHTSPSTNCMAGVVLAVGLLGPAGKQRLNRLFWNGPYPSIWYESVRATGRAMRMTGLGVLDLAEELRARLRTPEREAEHWWWVLVRDMAEHQTANHGAPPVWRFLPPDESALDIHRAVFGPNDAWDEDLGHFAMQRLGTDGEWLSGEIGDLRRPIEEVIARQALNAELDAR